MAISRNGNPTMIIVHHSAVTPGASGIEQLKQRASSYNNSMKDRSWAEKTKTDGKYPYLSYHYMIAKDGSIIMSQDEKYVMYHASNYNANYKGIGVCVDGNYETEQPNDKQKRTLAELIADKEKSWKVNVTVRGHKEVSDSATACPGKNIGTHSKGWMKEVIQLANDILNGVDEPTEPENPCFEVEKENKLLKNQNDILETENENLEKEVIALENTIDTLNDEIIELEEELKECKDLGEYDTAELLAQVEVNKRKYL